MTKFILAGAAIAGAAWGISMMPHEHSIGKFSTPLKGRTKNQRHNARLALSEIQDVVIAPGEEFSFNKRLKGWTAADGYRLAPVSFNGTLVDSWGGGVCQTSTTLYNAALESGMEIVERNHHTFAPSYAPPGRDAAVAYENIDLRFRNPYKYSVRIKGEADGDFLVIGIYSLQIPKELPKVVIHAEPQRQPGTRVIGDSGRRIVRNTGKQGVSVNVWRIWSNHREFVSSDNYAAMDRVIEYRPN